MSTTWTVTDYISWLKWGFFKRGHSKVECLDLTLNKLTEISDKIGNLCNLQELFLSRNKLTSLPISIGNLLTLNALLVSYNRLTTLPMEICNISALGVLEISNNKLKSIPSCIFKLKKLSLLDLSNNQITNVPDEIGNLVELDYLSLSNNQLSIIPSTIGNLVKLDSLDISKNLLKSIPASIGHLPILYELDISDNPFEYIPPNVRRFLDNQTRSQGIYQDAQSVHNSTIQQSIKDSIMRLLSITPVFNSDYVLETILSDSILSDFTKQSLIEYSRYDGLIGSLNVTFLEVLTVIWNRIIINTHSTDIKLVLNVEIKDAHCMCGIGRVSRLVNCLSGVDELVEVKIADNEQIGNVIAVIGARLTSESRYSVELHKQVANTELIELGYKQDVVDAWLSYIE